MNQLVNVSARFQQGTDSGAVGEVQGHLQNAKPSGQQASTERTDDVPERIFLRAFEETTLTFTA